MDMPRSAPRLRVAVLALGIFTIFMAANGCGGGTSKPSRSSTEVSHPLTKAQAIAYTRAVILHAGDLPLATVKRTTRNAQDRKLSHKARACLSHAGEVSPRLALATRESAFLEWHLHGEAAGLSSNAAVMPRAALAARNDAVYRSRRAIHCVAGFLSSTLLGAVGDRAEIGSIVESRLPFPLPGVRSGFGWRITIDVTIEGNESGQLIDYVGQEPRHLQAYVDVLGFTSGPAEIGVFAYGIPTPVPKWIEARAVDLLYGRAVMHRL